MKPLPPDPIDSDVLYATYAGFGGEHVWKSLDGGITWQAIDGRGASSLPTTAFTSSNTNGLLRSIGSSKP